MSIHTRTEYLFGYKDYMIQMLKATRTFEKCAKFIEPYLESNMKLLDCGCGPGSITTGLAQRISQGQVTAADISEEQLNITKEAAEKLGINNIEFKKADILNLPFDNNTFDIAYTNAVITQIKNNKKAISELYRVVKPNGIVATREIDLGTVIFYPDDPLLHESHNYRIQSLLGYGTDVLTGRKLKNLFTEVGFREIKISVSTELFSENGDMELICNYIATELREAPYNEGNLKSGKITEEKITKYQNAWKYLAKNPKAFLMVCWMEAIGVK